MSQDSPSVEDSDANEEAIALGGGKILSRSWLDKQRGTGMES